MWQAYLFYHFRFPLVLIWSLFSIIDRFELSSHYISYWNLFWQISYRFDTLLRNVPNKQMLGIGRNRTGNDWLETMQKKPSSLSSRLSATLGETRRRTQRGGQMDKTFGLNAGRSGVKIPCRGKCSLRTIAARVNNPLNPLIHLNGVYSAKRLVY